jgi:glycosyltransferase involved in cell wall biosynthesis
MGSLQLIDITFHANTEYADTDALIKAQQSSLNYVPVIKDKMKIGVIKHIGDHQTLLKEHTGFQFFHAKNSFFYIPFRTFRYLKSQQPDIMLVQGLKFPFQIIAMKWFLGKKTKIITKHHADHPPKWPKKLFQKIADHFTDAYLFTSFGNAKEWVDAGSISSYDKVYELPATFTSFSKTDKSVCKQKTGMGEYLHYLWVGRLNANKDPMTVLCGFEKYICHHPNARLHFIYQSAELLPHMKQYMEAHPSLQDTVFLHGYIPYEELPVWYSAADFFISASHREAGSAGLLEAMSCGCIPIVSAIPPAMKVISEGQYGLFFEPGDANELAEQLYTSAAMQREVFSKQVQLHFEKEYSLPAVAEKIYQLCCKLKAV